jgi:hypothetical protein
MLRSLDVDSENFRGVPEEETFLYGSASSPDENGRIAQVEAFGVSPGSPPEYL